MGIQRGICAIVAHKQDQQLRSGPLDLDAEHVGVAAVGGGEAFAARLYAALAARALGSG